MAGFHPLPPGQYHNAYFIDMMRSITLEFTYMPQEFTESKSVDWQNINILGRSEPIVSYAWSGPRMFNITLWFVAHGERADLTDEVIKPVRLIRSWAYPLYGSQSDAAQSSRMATPPLLLFVVGRWLRQRCVLRQYNITYKAPWSRHDDTNALSRIQDVFGPFDGASDALERFGLDIPTVAVGDKMIPYITQVRLTLQEVNDSVPDKSPFDTNDIYQGNDRLDLADITPSRIIIP